MRLKRLAEDINGNLLDEARKVCDAFQNAVKDQKCNIDVFFALRIDWLEGIDFEGCNYNSCNCGGCESEITFTPGKTCWEHLDDVFDEFHYDIGHNKSTGHNPAAGMGHSSAGY